MLELSNEAIIHSVKKTEETGNENIRLGVTGGGCAGYEYIIEWAHAIDSDDYVFDYGKFKVVIDNNIDIYNLCGRIDNLFNNLYI